MVEQRQVVQARGHVGMIWAEGLFLEHAARNPAHARSPKSVPDEPMRVPQARRTPPRARPSECDCAHMLLGNSPSSFNVRLLRVEAIPPRSWPLW
jgi:hypothetical protein